jgi:chaperonin GroEL
LADTAKPVQSVDDIRHVATISANNDSTIGDIIAMAVDKVGQDGSISIEESRSLETSLDITEGFKLDAGYCAGALAIVLVLLSPTNEEQRCTTRIL